MVKKKHLIRCNEYLWAVPAAPLVWGVAGAFQRVMRSQSLEVAGEAVDQPLSRCLLCLVGGE